MSNLEIVADQKSLEACCRQWRAAGYFAFDTEFIRDETYEAILGLIQINTGGEVVLVDPTARIDIGVFWELVTDEAVTCVVHAGKEDFEVCLHATGKPPRNVFDVQIAAGLAGYGYPLSLVRLVDQVLGKRITKGQTLTDWLRRPLTDQQIRYAIEDVAHLPAVYEKLSARLKETGRLGWASEEFKRYEDPTIYKPPVEERLFKFKGTKRLDALGLAVLERLIEWREQWAQRRNRPTRAMMRDDVLVEIARRRPRRATDLEVLRGFPQSRNRKVIRELLNLIEQAGAIPPEQRPQPYRPRQDTPMMKATLDVLSAVARAICHEERLSYDLLGGTQRLRELLDYELGRLRERPPLLCGWREHFIGRRLVDLLEGRSELHLSGWPDDLKLDVVNHAPTRGR
jgi:ribonuclease D